MSNMITPPVGLEMLRITQRDLSPNFGLLDWLRQRARDEVAADIAILEELNEDWQNFDDIHYVKNVDKIKSRAELAQYSDYIVKNNIAITSQISQFGTELLKQKAEHNISENHLTINTEEQKKNTEHKFISRKDIKTILMVSAIVIIGLAILFSLLYFIGKYGNSNWVTIEEYKGR